MEGPIALPPFLRFGTGLRSPEIVAWWDEPGYMSVKVRDPDGYVVEVAWEP